MHLTASKCYMTLNSWMWLDEKLLGRAAEILLKDTGKTEGIETNPLNPENLPNTAVEELISETL